MTTYRISTYDSNDDPSKDGEWTLRASGLKPFALREWIRKYEGQSYERDNSILIEREKQPDA